MQLPWKTFLDSDPDRALSLAFDSDDMEGLRAALAAGASPLAESEQAVAFDHESSVLQVCLRNANLPHREEKFTALMSAWPHSLKSISNAQWYDAMEWDFAFDHLTRHPGFQGLAVEYAWTALMRHAKNNGALSEERMEAILERDRTPPGVMSPMVLMETLVYAHALAPVQVDTLLDRLDRAGRLPSLAPAYAPGSSRYTRWLGDTFQDTRTDFLHGMAQAIHLNHQGALIDSRIMRRLAQLGLSVQEMNFSIELATTIQAGQGFNAWRQQFAVMRDHVELEATVPAAAGPVRGLRL